jgi:hypothetical protein
MTTTPKEPESIAVEEMLRTMQARIRAYETMPQRSLGAIARAREALGGFRLAPLGGRLLPLKRLVFWFTASSFDRQAKVQEKVLDALDEVGRELVDLRNRMAVLQMEIEQAAQSLAGDNRAATARAEEESPPRGLGRAYR